MAQLSLLVSPHVISWSKNPVSFRFKVSPYLAQERTVNTAVRVTVLLETLHYASDFQEIKTLQIRPDATGYADIDISVLLDAQLQYDFPTMDGYAQNCRKQIRRFVLRYALVDDYGQTGTTVQTTEYHVLKGGLSTTNWHRDRFFKNYEAAPSFLTWNGKKEAQTVRPEQSEFLYFLLPAAQPNGFTILRNLQFSDQSSVASTTLPAAYPDPTLSWQLFCLRAGADFSGVATPSGLTAIGSRAKVQLSNREITKVSAIDPIPLIDKAVQLMWRNSLGGIDTHVFTGLKEDGFQVQKETATRIDAVQFFQTEIEQPSEFNINIRSWDKSKADTGWIPKTSLDLMRDLLRTGAAYVFRNQQWVPIRIDNSTTTLYTNRDGMFSLTLEYFDATGDTAFTPDDYITVPAVSPQVQYFTAEQETKGAATLRWKLPSGYSTIQIEYNPANTSDSNSKFYISSGTDSSMLIDCPNYAINNSPFRVNTYWRARIVTAVNASGTVTGAGPWFAWQQLLLYRFIPPIVRTLHCDTLAGNASRQLAVYNDFKPLVTTRNGRTGTFVVAVGSNGVGTAGGTFVLNNGILTYTPPSASFTGTDMVPYTATEPIVMNGQYTFPSAQDRIIVTVNPVAGTIATGLSGLPYIKLELRNPRDVQPPPWNLNIIFQRIYGADAYVTFWKDVNARIPLDLTGTGIGLTLNTDYTSNNASFPPPASDIIQTVASGHEMNLGVVLTSYNAPSNSVLFAARNYLSASALFITL